MNLRDLHLPLPPGFRLETAESGRALLILIACLLSFAAFAQVGEIKTINGVPVDSIAPNESSDFSIVVKTNPFTPIWGTIPFTAEYRFVGEFVTARQQSWMLGVSYLGKSPLLNAIEDSAASNGELPFTVRGYRLQAGYRFYLNKMLEPLGLSSNGEAPKGYYIMPHFSYSEAKFSDRYLNQYDVYLRITHVNYNVLMGYQSFIRSNIAIDMFAGLGYKENRWIQRDFAGNFSTEETDELGEYYNSPVKISLGFHVGIAF